MTYRLTNHFALKVLVLLIISLNTTCFSQQSQLEIDSVTSVSSMFSISEDKDMFFVNKYNQSRDLIYLFDYANNQLSLMDTLDGWNAYERLEHTNGMYYVTYDYGSNGSSIFYRFNWINENGVRTNSSQIYEEPTILGANGQYVFYYYTEDDGDVYLEGFSNDAVYLPTINVFQEVPELHFVVDSLDYFVSGDNPNQLTFHSFTDTSGIQNEFSIPTSYENVRFMEEYNNLHYFAVNQDSVDKIWEVDFTQNTFQLFSEVPAYSTIDIENDEFYRYYYQYPLRGSLSNPQLIDTIPYAAGLSAGNPQRIQLVNKNVLRGYSDDFGFEPFYVDDSIYLLKDIGKGIQSGWRHIESSSYPDYEYIKFAPFIYQKGSDSIFSIMTNYNDDRDYLYSIIDTTITSYFPIDVPGYYSYTGQKVYDNTFYLTMEKDNKYIINWRSLANNIEQQPSSSTSDTTELEWAKNFYQVIEKRFYAMNDRQQHGGIKLLPDGGVLSTTRMTRNYDYKVLDDSREILDDAKGSFLLYRQDSTGKLRWHRSFGPSYFGSFVDHSLHTDIDQMGDIYVSGVFFEDYFTGEDTIKVDRAANFIHKFDGETGETIWFKIISENYYYSDFEIDQMKIIDGKIFTSFMYTDFQCNIDGASLTNQLVSPINAIAIFDTTGNLLQARNAPTEWENAPGATSVMDYYNGQMLTVQSQGAYNVSSSCGYDTWGYFNQLLDTDGNVDETISVYSSHLGSATCGFMANESIYSFGYYRGTMDLNYFKNTTSLDENCYAFKGFMYRYDLAKGEFSEMKVSKGRFFPFYSKYHNNHYYLYGAVGESNDLTIVKFDQYGNELGYKTLGQKLNSLTYEAYQFFDVSDAYLAIIGTQFVNNEEYEVPRRSSTHRYTTIIKTANSNWSTDKTFFENKERIFASNVEDDLVVYPNPVNDEFSIMFKDPIYTDLEIFDLNGKKVASYQVNDDYVQHFKIRDLAQGVYIFKIFNTTTQKTLKVVKQ